MVCSPEDAYRCFMATEIDCLVVGNRFLDREKQLHRPLTDHERAAWLRRPAGVVPALDGIDAHTAADVIRGALRGSTDAWLERDLRGYSAQLGLYRSGILGLHALEDVTRTDEHFRVEERRLLQESTQLSC